MTSISENIATVLNGQFKLRSKPVADTVVVTVNGQPIDKSTYKVTRSGIKFDNPPDKGAKVSVEYRAETGSLNKKFKLSKFAVDEGMTVEIDGVVLEESQYYVDEVNQELVLDEEPELGAEILVSFDAEGVSIRKFMIAKGLTEDGMKALVDGEEVDFSYNPANGIIEFTIAPSEQSEIIIMHLVPID